MKVIRIYKNGTIEDVSQDKVIIEMSFEEYLNFKCTHGTEIYNLLNKATEERRWID